ncbi:transcriptional repressor C-terminal [Plantibacter cousiniae]|uniref:Transcriptional repressor C-terminal n=1 Tax=Plantibacter cousiniae (nom. nud.) TaxID=199709 RepID=A0ABY1LHH6_9MICO|nr:transcriptional repressor C-terminal [Plantibacter cousiniae]
MDRQTPLGPWRSRLTTGSTCVSGSSPTRPKWARSSCCPPRGPAASADHVGAPVARCAHRRRPSPAFQGSPITRALPGLVSDLEADTALREVFRRDYFEARRATSRAVLEHAVERGDIQDGLDMELTLDLLAAPLYYRAFFGHQPIDDGLAERTVLSVLNGVASVDWQRHHRARPA